MLRRPIIHSIKAERKKKKHELRSPGGLSPQGAKLPNENAAYRTEREGLKGRCIGGRDLDDPWSELDDDQERSEAKRRRITITVWARRLHTTIDALFAITSEQFKPALRS